jgi:hypothetical protein
MYCASSPALVGLLPVPLLAAELPQAASNAATPSAATGTPLRRNQRLRVKDLLRTL